MSRRNPGVRPSKPKGDAIREYPIPPVPKIIHQVWLPNWAQVPSGIRGTRHEWCRLNPTWEYKFWSERDANDLVSTHYPEFSSMWASLKDERVIKKADMVRLLILHRFGGIYADMDLMPLVPLVVSDALHYSAFAVSEAAVGTSVRFANGFFGSVPGLSAWIKSIRAAVRMPYASVLAFLGPKVVSRYLRKEPRVMAIPRHHVLDTSPNPVALCQNLEHRSWGEPSHHNAPWYKC